MRITCVCGCCARTRSTRSSPSPSGKIRSVKTIAGDSRSIASSAPLKELAKLTSSSCIGPKS